MTDTEHSPVAASHPRALLRSLCISILAIEYASQPEREMAMAPKDALGAVGISAGTILAEHFHMDSAQIAQALTEAYGLMLPQIQDGVRRSRTKQVAIARKGG